MSTPKRIQLSRKKGFRLPPDAVNVARPTRWGNPFTVAICGSASVAIGEFRRWLFEGDRDSTGRHTLRMGIEYLRGHDLACWCKPGEPCHADVWLELANDPRAEPVQTIIRTGEYVIMGRRSRITQLPDSLGWGSFEFEEIGSQGGGAYHAGMGKVYSPALLDLLAGKEAS